MSQLSIVNCNASGVIPEWTTESFEAFEEGTSNRSHSTTTDEETSNDSYIPGTFEGPEKTLEVIFKHGEGKTGGLRNMDRAQLDELCTQAKCTILSKASTAHLDAYVLSESSLFVYDYRLIMKTCGTTTLLRCLGTLFEYADRLGMQLSWVGYSRKNFLFPTQQLWPHVSFTEEVRYIEQHESLQQRLNGDGHVLGPLNGDHWFVYVAEAKRSFSASQSPATTPGAISACPSVLDLPARAGASSPALDTPCVANNRRNQRSHSLSSANTSGDEDEEIKHDDSHRTSSAGKKTTDADNCVIENAKEEQQRSQLTRALASLSAQRHSTYRTFNMMMFDMAPEVAATFFQGTNGLTGKEMTVAAGIPALCPGYTIDEAAFQPCGYSMNAVSDGNYATIHITPEAACSYVSFETNEQLEDYAPLLRRVLATFRPQRFVLTMFGDDDAIDCLPRMPTTHRSYSDIAGCPQGACYVRTTSTCTTVESQRQKCAMACYAYQPPMVEPAM